MSISLQHRIGGTQMYEDLDMITTEAEAKELYNDVVETFYDEHDVDEDTFEAPDFELVDEWKQIFNDYDANEVRMLKEDVRGKKESPAGPGEAYVEQRMTDILTQFYRVNASE